jgi:signal transduction histidine kinase
LSASIVRNAIGQPLYFVTQIQDITARKQMEEQLQRYANDLEKMVEARAQRIHELEKQQIENEKLAATGRMAARIAHEINNPLGMIQTAFRLISRAVPVEHRHHHYVGKIEKEIDRIAQIVRQMLDLHKPHQESPKTFRADEAIGEVIALMKPNFHARQLGCEQDLQRAREIVTLPENMLRQILYNVVLNAAEASPADGLVRITAEIKANRLHIAVSDRGAGISEEIKARIFEPFFTTKSNGSTGGMGLGLSICKSLIEAMNGSIELESKPGEGTVCRIAIPLDKKDKNEKPATEL